MNRITSSVLAGFFGVLLGFSVSQVSVGNEVREHTVRIQALEKLSVEERKRTDDRIFEVAALVRETISLNKEFIQLLRVQNELLQRQVK